MTDGMVGPDESAHRWIPPIESQWDESAGLPKATVFRYPVGVSCSVWLVGRLLGDPDVLLHPPAKERHGRLQLAVGEVREHERAPAERWGFEIELDPDGTTEEYSHLESAHGVLSPASPRQFSRAEAAALIQIVQRNLPGSVPRRPRGGDLA